MVAVVIGKGAGFRKEWDGTGWKGVGRQWDGVGQGGAGWDDSAILLPITK